MIQSIVIFNILIINTLEAQIILLNEVHITEFLAINDSIHKDENGNYSDWIEIFNPTTNDVDLSGWSLTDKSDNLRKWVFPQIIIPAESYLVVFASGNDTIINPAYIHTNFKLSGDGEFLALVKPDSVTIATSFEDTYPAQTSNISYGLYEGNFEYMKSPTPGAENIGDIKIKPPYLSMPHGFYDSTFKISINSSVSTASIYFTVDGSEPTSTNGTLYTDSIIISTTTVLRAIALAEGLEPSKIATISYIFLDDVKNQPNDPEGYPATWGNYIELNGNSIADYEMDPEIITHPDYQNLMIPSLLSVPTISLVTDRDYLFSHTLDSVTGGIYIYEGAPGNLDLPTEGSRWERSVSCEYIIPDSSESGFQVNCGIRIQGGHSRRPEKSPKHSFRLVFRREYGPGKLEYPIFGNDASEDFNTLVLRAAYGNSWRHMASDQRVRAQHIRDPWAKDTQFDMGYFSAHNKFAHVFINGLYWGLYNISERIDGDFMESYLGGDNDDYDVIKDYEENVDGNSSAWDTLWARVSRKNIMNDSVYYSLIGCNPDGSANDAIESYLDPESLIDYMLLNFYGGNNDWDHHNWIAARNRKNPEKGFQFFCWDTEKILENIEENYVYENNSNRPSGIFRHLMNNENFKMLFEERVDLHLKNNGALTPSSVTERWMERAEEIELAMVSESARWGDYRRDVHSWSGGPYTLYTRNDHWHTEQTRLLEEYFPYRTQVVLEDINNAGYLYSIAPPLFSMNGGKIPQDYELSMFAYDGNIYYTRNGTDPRDYNGIISEDAVLYTDSIMVKDTTVITARAKFNQIWSKAVIDTFYNEFYVPTDMMISSVQKLYNVKIYPNPVQNNTSIEYYLKKGGNINISIYSISGAQIKEVYSGYLNKGQHNINWNSSNLHKGIYILHINADGYRERHKLIKL
ncbi:CotH kinase family protein [Bacteroidota bacterium]